VSFYGLTVETSPTSASPASPAVSPTAASSYQAPTAMPTVSFYGLTVETSPTTELDPDEAIIGNANRRHLLRWVIMHPTPRRRLWTSPVHDSSRRAAAGVLFTQGLRRGQR
jgi:hypothetical protein